MSVRKTSRVFAENYDEGPGCWVWKGARMNGKGYGAFFGKIASREAWVLRHGAIPEGAHVLHKCDNPACVNPDHLFLGTNEDNCKDKARKGRAFKMFGPDNPMFGKRPPGLDKFATCPYCGGVFNLVSFGRWHGDRCKEKQNESK